MKKGMFTKTASSCSTCGSAIKEGTYAYVSDSADAVSCLDCTDGNFVDDLIDHLYPESPTVSS